MEIIKIPLSKIEPNTGQLEGLPANPRTISDERMTLLKQNIENYPELLDYRSLMVYPLDNGNYIIIGGNQRYYAQKELGFTESPCVIIDKDTDVERLKAYAILDNNGFGKWDYTMLESDWDISSLTDWGVDATIFDGGDLNLDDFFEEGVSERGPQDEKIIIVIPHENADMKDDICQEVSEIIKKYDGVKVS